MNNIQVLVITGPTASGKSELAHNLAKKYNTAIISADSMQIYKYMDIGTAKPSKEQMQEVEYYMVDFVNPNTNFSVHDYVIDAKKCINDLHNRNKKIIIVGGTGLYIRSLLFSYTFFDCFDPNLRKKLEDILIRHGKTFLYNLLGKMDKEEQSKLSENDTKRIIRALEISILKKQKKSDCIKQEQNHKEYDCTILAIQKDREVLYDDINNRVNSMIENGLFDEVKSLMQYRGCNSMQAIGYKQVIDYFDKKMTKEETIEKIKQYSRNYAKRQITYLKKIPEIRWYNIEDIYSIASSTIENFD